MHRYVTSQAYDRWLCAATFFDSGARVRDVVTVHPQTRPVRGRYTS